MKLLNSHPVLRNQIGSVETIDQGYKLSLNPNTNHSQIMVIICSKLTDFTWVYHDPYLDLQINIPKKINPKSDLVKEKKPRDRRKVKDQKRMETATSNSEPNSEPKEYLKPIAYQSDGQIEIKYDDPRGVIIRNISATEPSIKVLCPVGSNLKKISETEYGCKRI